MLSGLPTFVMELLHLRADQASLTLHVRFAQTLLADATRSTAEAQEKWRVRCERQVEREQRSMPQVRSWDLFGRWEDLSAFGSEEV